jgi:predicted sulfurtransferase
MRESTPNCPFLLIISTGQYWSICFHERNPIEYCNRARRSFLLKLTIKVRDKIVADGLVDKTFDVTNIGIHLKAEFNELLEDPNTIVVDMRNHYEARLVILQTQLSQM